MVRDSMLENKEKYIEHLESQLAAMQTQLSSATSPTVTQARSLKMRALNAKIRSLQEELAEWESKYHDRISEELDERNQIEAALRSRIRSLEGDAENYNHTARELQSQLEQTRRSLEAVESVNLDLETRLETFAHLVAISPQKQEFNFTPVGERRTHTRSQSSLSRFPTTSTLLPSADSSNMPPPQPSAFAQDDIQEEILPARPASLPAHTYTPSHENVSERDPMYSMISSKRHSWTCFPDTDGIDGMGGLSTGKSKPYRRMRRFHARSVMPKPLILSSSTQMNPGPATAMLMESNDQPLSFQFPGVDTLPTQDSPLVEDSILRGRARAHTSADCLTPEDLQQLSPLQRTSIDSHKSFSTVLPQVDLCSSESEDTPRDYSSLGSAVGRNLFEELSRARGTESNTNTLTSGYTISSSPPSCLAVDFSPLPESTRVPSSASSVQLHQQRLIHQRSMSEQTALPLRSRSRTVTGLQSLAFFSRPSSKCSSCYRHVSRNLETSLAHRRGTTRDDRKKAQIVTIFSDLWNHPYMTSRRCLARAQNLMLFSSRAGRVQWWLLTFLLGPMVCRNLISGTGVRNPLSSSGSKRSPVFLCQSQQNGVGGAGRSRQADGETDEAETKNVYSHAEGCPCYGLEGLDAIDQTAAAAAIKKMQAGKHSPWLWIKFSVTLAFAIGAAIKDGPASLLEGSGQCTCVSMAGRPASEIKQS